MSSATAMPGFKPIASLTADYWDVEMQLTDGSVVIGWMQCGWTDGQPRPAYFTVPGHAGGYERIHPVAWRPIPLPIAQRSAA